MYIKNDFSFDDLKEEVWGGAEDTLEIIENNDMEDELMDFLEGYFVEVPTITEVNDLLRFESEYIFEVLGINEDEEKDEEDEDGEE